MSNIYSVPVITVSTSACKYGNCWKNWCAISMHASNGILKSYEYKHLIHINNISEQLETCGACNGNADSSTMWLLPSPGRTESYARSLLTRKEGIIWNLKATTCMTGWCWIDTVRLMSIRRSTHRLIRVVHIHRSELLGTGVLQK